MKQAAGIARDYHERTAHRLDGYARGPEALDWSAQPEPFRHFDGARHLPLPLCGDNQPLARYAGLFDGSIEAQPLSRDSIGTLFELSLGISAWKAYMGDRWALRCNPSSGNLHPTEGYAVCAAIPGIGDGVYHYRPDEHALEQRAALPFEAPEPRLVVGLSSILWREGWKYGERAFRYCQLDTGHALAAFAYAAGCLGWRIRLLDHHGSARTGALLGLSDAASFAGVEAEIPELLFEVSADGSDFDIPESWFEAAAAAAWTGKANRLDPSPYGTWPVLNEVAAATVAAPQPSRPADATSAFPDMAALPGDTPAATLIRQRRSAQHFDPRPLLPKSAFLRMLDATLPRPGTPPWPANQPEARIHLVLFVHRVEGLRQGLYALPRSEEGLTAMRTELRSSFSWEQVDTGIAHLPLHLLVNADCRGAARTLCCHQAIGGDAAFAVAMLGEFDKALEESAAGYRQLFVEAGQVGQSFYLEAENAGFRGTGIGCYFDPAVHDTLGISDTPLQSLYHFTVGMPLTDERIQTLPPYAHLKETRR